MFIYIHRPAPFGLFVPPIRAAPIARHVSSPSHTTTTHWPTGTTFRYDFPPSSAVVMHLVAHVLEGPGPGGVLALVGG
jgi:hypothetical protein